MVTDIAEKSGLFAAGGFQPMRILPPTFTGALPIALEAEPKAHAGRAPVGIRIGVAGPIPVAVVGPVIRPISIVVVVVVVVPLLIVVALCFFPPISLDHRSLALAVWDSRDGPDCRSGLRREHERSDTSHSDSDDFPTHFYPP